MRKQRFCMCENIGGDKHCSNCKADQRLYFRYTDRGVQFLYFLNPNFQASIDNLCLYSPVCVGPVRHPYCWFSHDAAHFCLPVTANLITRAIHFFFIFFFFIIFFAFSTV